MPQLTAAYNPCSTTGSRPNQTIFAKKSTRVGPNSYPGSGGM